MPTENVHGVRTTQRLRRFSAFAAGILMLAGLTAAVPAQAATTVQSLSGETLIQSGPGGLTASSYNCSDPSRVFLTASGVATGPYPGTFTETLEIAFDQSVDPGNLYYVNATFTITSVNGTVTGTKRTTGDTAGGALCNEVGALNVIADLTYTAQITTPSGTATDQGVSNATTFKVCPTTCGTFTSPNAFQESFVSQTFTPAPPPAPTTAEQCKKGGWKNYPALGFKNQGDCTSYVATHGKNQPAGPKR
ncbi:hypothetical protein QFZ65_001099 [Arthrobacter sp. B3I9]|uniref:hypothetical protein n=1 Tax=Arthrobacter sp. B3I9 TaxID=3042270 RepID=UPI00278CCDC7|nr:hypothetical protein [Arthrobacter sp. B3I9]MDQ0849161.1 hypothetical protein [Arthrobacter sp. B3I9]